MKQFRSMSYPYVVWITVLIVVPMLLIVGYAFTVNGTDLLDFQFTLDNFQKFFQDTVFLEVLIRSLRVALITTVLCLLLGYPAAYIIANALGKNKFVLIMLVTLPTWINMLVRTYAWVGILQKDGLFNTVLGFFGIAPLELMYTDTAVIIGMVYNFIPFMILQIYTALTKMDHALIEAAADLGANRIMCFLKVTFPLSLPGVISGITLVFLPAVSSFFIPKLLGGGSYMLIGNVIESQFLTVGNWSFGSAISLIMAVIIMISMYITRRVDKNGGEAA